MSSPAGVTVLTRCIRGGGMCDGCGLCGTYGFEAAVCDWCGCEIHGEPIYDGDAMYCTSCARMLGDEELEDEAC